MSLQILTDWFTALIGFAPGAGIETARITAAKMPRGATSANNTQNEGDARSILRVVANIATHIGASDLS